MQSETHEDQPLRKLCVSWDGTHQRCQWPSGHSHQVHQLRSRNWSLKGYQYLYNVGDANLMIFDKGKFYTLTKRSGWQQLAMHVSLDECMVVSYRFFIPFALTTPADWLFFWNQKSCDSHLNVKPKRILTGFHSHLPCDCRDECQAGDVDEGEELCSCYKFGRKSSTCSMLEFQFGARVVLCIRVVWSWLFECKVETPWS